MKKNFTFLALTLFSFVFSQSYKDKISAEMCTCAKEMKTEAKTSKQIEFELGICMMKIAMPYRDEIMRDFNIDLRNDIGKEDKMIKLGETFGMIIINDCPEIFQKIMPASYFDDEDPYSKEVKMLNGVISKIEKNDFVIFHITGDNRVLTKLHWVSKIESNLDLPVEFQGLQGKRVNVSYHATEIFDPKFNQYRSVNMITSLKTD